MTLTGTPPRIEAWSVALMAIVASIIAVLALLPGSAALMGMAVVVIAGSQMLLRRSTE